MGRQGGVEGSCGDAVGYGEGYGGTCRPLSTMLREGEVRGDEGRELSGEEGRVWEVRVRYAVASVDARESAGGLGELSAG